LNLQNFITPKQMFQMVSPTIPLPIWELKLYLVYPTYLSS